MNRVGTDATGFQSATVACCAHIRVRAPNGAPFNEALVYDEGDFHEGSRDVFRCGPPNDLKFRGVTNDRLRERGHRIIELRVSIQDHIKIT